jgi:hypothetical protein
MDYDLWEGALLSPKETFKKAKKNANYTDTLKNMISAFIITFVISSIFQLLGFLMAGKKISMESDTFLLPIYLFIGVLFLFVVWLIEFLFLSSLSFILSKAVGGKGNFVVQTYLTSLFRSPMTILVSLLFSFRYFDMPMDLRVMALFAFIAFVCNVYLLSIALKETHGYNARKSAAISLISQPAFIAILLVLFIMVLLMIFSPSSIKWT